MVEDVLDLNFTNRGKSLEARRKYVAPVVLPAEARMSSQDLKETLRTKKKSQASKIEEGISAYQRKRAEQKAERRLRDKERQQAIRNPIRTVSFLEEKEEVKTDRSLKSAKRREEGKSAAAENKRQTALYRQARDDERRAKQAAKSKRRLENRTIQTESGTVLDIASDLLNIISPFGDHPLLMKTFGPVVNYVYQTYRSRNVIDVWSAHYALARSLNITHSSIKFTTEQAHALMCWVFAFGPISTESASERLEDLQVFLSRLMSCEVVDIFKSVIGQAMSFSLFDEDVASFFSGFIKKSKKMTIGELFSLCLDLVIKVVKLGERIFQGESLDSVLLSGNPVHTILRQATRHLQYSERIYTGLPVEGGMEICEFVTEGEKIHSQMTRVLKTLSPTHDVYNYFVKTHGMLGNELFNLRARLQAGNRPVPYGIILFGAPSIGKSVLINFLADLWSTCKGRDFQPSHIYHRTMSSEYWEGYSPLSHRIIHYSEIGNVHANIAKVRGDPTIMELTSLIDAVQFPVDMAFDGKGKTYAIPDMVIADTNSPDMGLEWIVKNPAAYMRRFLFVEPVVKPEFRVPGTSSLDSQKSLASDLPEMDRWTFNVYTYVANGPVQRVRKDLLSASDPESNVYALVKCLTDLFNAHIERQDELIKRGPSMFNSARYVAKDLNISESKDDTSFFDNSGIGMSPLIPNIEVIETKEPIGVQSGIDNIVPQLIGAMREDDDYIELTWETRVVKAGGLLALDGIVYLLLSLILLVLNTDWGFNTARWAITKQFRGRVADASTRMKNIVWGYSAKHYRSAMYVAVGASVIGALVVCKKILDRYVKATAKTESHSIFLTKDGVSSELKAFEEVIGASDQRVRIPVKDHALWNVMTPAEVSLPHRGDVSDLGKMVHRNLRAATVVTAASTRTTLVFGIYANFAIVNTHSFSGSDTAVLRVATTSQLMDTTVFKETAVDSSNRVDLGNDVTVVALSGVLFRDIRHHITLCDAPRDSYNGWFHGKDTRAVLLRTPQRLSDSVSGTFTVDSIWEYTFPDHKVGLCGSPLLVEGVGNKVVGIHAGGQGKCGYAVPIFYPAIEDAISRMNLLMPLASRGVIPVQSLEEPVPKSPFRFELFHGLEYFGKTPGPVLVKNKSKVSRSPLSPLVEALEETSGTCVDKKFAPPMMQPGYVDGEYVSPYNIALRKMSKQRPCLNNAVLRRVVSEFTQHILEGIGDIDLSPLTLEDAINGVENDPFTRRINVGTGAGFPFGGKKADHLPIFSEENGRLIREPTEELGGRIAKTLSEYVAQETHRPVYIGCLKDEPREVAKVAQGKTRLFFISALEELIVSRMLLSPFYTLMVEKSTAFCCSIGINMHSGADNFVKTLLDFSPDLMEGDYSNYDQSMPWEIGHAAATVVYNVLKARGYNETALRMVSGLLTDLLFPVLEVNRDLFELPGMQPSGKYATAEDNSLRGVILLMYAWYSLEETRDLPFFDNVLPRVFGDDVLASVKSGISFNNLVYRDFCDANYGISYTPALKGNSMTEFMDITTCSFLKRKFVYNEKLSRWVAPLDIDSLFKTLTWMIPSQVLPRDEQCLSAVTSVLWELVFHLDEDKHDSFRAEAEKCMTRIRHGSHINLPTWNDIVNTMFGLDSTNMIVVEPECDRELRIVAESAVVCTHQGVPLFSWDPSFPKVENHPGVADAELSTLKEVKFSANYFYENVSPSLALEDQIAVYENQLASISKEIEANRSLYSELSDTGLRNRMLRSEEAELWNMMHKESMLRAKMRDLELTLRAIRSMLRRNHEIKTESGTLDTENVLELPGMGKEDVSAGDAVVSEEGAKNVLDLGDFLSRPILIYEGSVPLNTDFGLVLPVWDLLTKEPSVRAKLRNFAYLHGDMQVRISISGSPFHYGRLMVSYQPYAKYNLPLQSLFSSLGPLGRPPLLNYLSQAHGATTMDVKANKPLEVSCPFISPKPMFRLFNNTTTVLSAATSYQDMVNAGDLYIYTINQLKAASASATAPYIQVYAWMPDAELGTNTATQLEIVTESGVASHKMAPKKDERVVGPVEEFSSGAGEICDALTEVPVVGEYAKAGSVVLKGLSKLAAHFGWSKPVAIDKPLYMKLEPFQNGSQTIGFETAKRVTLDPLQEVTVDPRVVGEDIDSMAISAICERPTYIHTASWASSTPIMANPFYIANVTPSLATYRNVSLTNYVQPSSMAFAAAPFMYWRGDVTFRIEVVCSAFHRGKIAIVYEPNNAQMSLINSSFNYNKQYIRIIDIQDTQNFEFTVNWASYRPWLRVSSKEDTAGNQGSSVSQLGIGYANGYIAITPFTALQSPDGSAASLNIYVYSNDMRFNQLSSLNMPTTRSVPTPPAGSIATQSGVLTVSDEMKMVTLNPSTASLDHISEICFGEQPASFRGLLKRVVTNEVSDTPTYGTSGPVRLRVVKNILPRNQFAYGGTPGTLTPDLYSYLKYAYLGMRGGVRHRYHVNLSAGSNGTMQARITRDAPTSVATATTLSAAPFAAKSTLDGTVMFVPSTVGGVEVEFPFYTNNLFFFAFSNDPTPGSATDEMNAVYTRTTTIDLELQGPLAVGQFIDDFSAGEDFSFLRYCGSPIYSY